MKDLLFIILTSLFSLFLLSSCKTFPKPKPYGPSPSKRQINWAKLEFYGFLHFSLNTFTGKEWGLGSENPILFNPTDFSAKQIVSSAKAGGMKGLILTCKHHDGFCLWPSKYTEHSIKNSPYKNGKGDIVKEISDECKRQGLKFGIYLSPWDRNSKHYAKPEYIILFRNQLKELLTNYGDIFEVWIDGANGGSGYYGGANEKRIINKGTYYDWKNTFKIIRKLQKNACIFSDIGPDIRWIGNESGYAKNPSWATYTPIAPNKLKPNPGQTKYKRGETGTHNGKYWMPAECDVSIRPGWFYHKKEDLKVRSAKNILNLYFKSVGLGASLNLNIPPNKNGQINKEDIASLKQFNKILQQIFKTNLANSATLKASNIRGQCRSYKPQNMLNNNSKTYWSTDDKIKQAEVILSFKKKINFNIILLSEYIPLGQRVNAWAIDSMNTQGEWKEIAKGQSIGIKRLYTCKKLIITNKVRLRILDSAACPAINNFGLFLDKR